MAEEQRPSSPFAAIGAALVAALAGLATVADDCGRAATHLGGAADDVGRVAAHGDDLGAAAAHADDLGAVAAHGDDAAIVAAQEATLHADDAGRAGAEAAHAADDLAPDVAEALLDVGIEVVGAVQDAAAPPADGAPAAPGARSGAVRPRLLVARAANPPADGPFDPLVLLVDEPDAARLASLAANCATLEHRCVVLACPPPADACFAAWRGHFADAAADPVLAGEPASFGRALALAPPSEATRGTWIGEAVTHPTGPAVNVLRARR